MTDTYFDPTSTGVLMPQLAAAAARDPRRLLVQSLMQQGQNSLQTPTYTPGAALAKALTIGLGGVTGAKLNSDYEDQNRAVQDVMQRAISAGQGGTDPTTGQPTGGLSEMARVLASNPLTAAQGLNIPIQQATLQAKARVDLINELAKQGKTFDQSGNVVPLPNILPTNQSLAAAQSGGAKAGEIAAETAGQPGLINATAVPKANAAALEEAAKNPALISRAGGITAADLLAQTKYKPGLINATAAPEAAAAAAKSSAVAPVEVFKELFKPIVDRTTGEVTIPGVDASMTAKVMQGYGVTPNDLVKSLPSQRQNAPLLAFDANRPPPGQIQSGTAPNAPVAQATPAAPVPSQIPTTTPQNTAPPVPAGVKSPSEEVPKVDLPTGLLPAGPGTIIQGRDPVAIKAGEAAVEQANGQYKEIQDAAHSATAIRSQLGTMRTMLQNGGFNTSATAPARATLSSYLNATLGPDVAKSVTGIDPAQAEVFNKDATRMGLTFARQTEGAREAVAAIKIALGANPSLANTMEGNKKIIDLLDAGAQRDADAQKYGDAFFEKNKHYVGFPGWFNQAHPAAEYTSKVIPYNAPRAQDGSVDLGQLQPNVTYQGPNGPGIWTGAGFKSVK